MTAEAEEGPAREYPRRLGRPVELPLWMVGVLAAAPLLLGLLLWSLLDRRTSHVSPPPVASFEELLPSIAGVTGSPIVHEQM